MASWAVEGLYPDNDFLADARAHIEGSVTVEDLLAKHKAL